MASTKAYSTQLAVIYMIALYMAEQLGEVSQRRFGTGILHDLQRSAGSGGSQSWQDKKTIQYFASQYFNAEDMYFIGRNVDYAASLEASLKLKEISYIHSEAYTGRRAEARPHLLDRGRDPGDCHWPRHEKLFDKMMSNVQEVKARGAVVLGITVRGNSRKL